MKYTSTCNRTHAADAYCAPATQSAFCTASDLFALDTAIPVSYTHLTLPTILLV